VCFSNGKIEWFWAFPLCFPLMSPLLLCPFIHSISLLHQHHSFHPTFTDIWKKLLWESILFSLLSKALDLLTPNTFSSDWVCLDH
jgi:hypothetical protein